MATQVRPSESLESGDRLTREEFHRRYCARPDIARAELVQGVVYVASPTRFHRHAKPHRLVIAWLDTYTTLAPDVELAIEATVFLGVSSEVRPDACLFRASPRGAVRITEDDYLEGAPDLVVEIAASSATYDLHDKMEVYRRAGVPEYIVWRVLDRQIDWFDLVDGRYVRRQPDANGIIESRTFPGLRLNVTAMLAENCAGVLAALRPPA
jgi:Uma2 family endonuclease